MNKRSRTHHLETISSTFDVERRRMVEQHLEARGIQDQAILSAFEQVRREAFLPEELADFAYQDTPLPIAAEQTISQPFIVALMAEALKLRPEDRVLEVGTGSGYAAAILSCLVREVYTIERHQVLAEGAESRLKRLGFSNVHVRCGDGTLGWREYAPFDAIVVAAGGPEAPESLRAQLTIGGRLVIPVGAIERGQRLLRITRETEHSYRTEDLGGVRFVPLIGEQGWEDRAPTLGSRALLSPGSKRGTSTLIRECAEPIRMIERADMGALLERVGNARVVLIGEATHGTSEFYRMRAEITRQLIARKGFRFVAIEGDWPDAMHVNRFLTGKKPTTSKYPPFTRFPTWMWRNIEVVEFLKWLHDRNSQSKDSNGKVGFFGLDLYSLYCSIDAVISYLQKVDVGTANIARQRYGCLSPWESDPASYGRAALTGQYRSCEHEVIAMLGEMLQKRIEYQGAAHDGAEYFDVVQNARLIANAEQYYRRMYYDGPTSWNLRDRHMFDTLLSLLEFHGADSKAIVWAHNSHVGDARATEMTIRGELNIGELCRAEFGDLTFNIGFGTHQGIVAAASQWGGEMELKTVRPSHSESYERLFHDSDRKAFLLHLREPARREIRDELSEPRLSRAIGVIYRPESELQSHYYQTVLPRQFDEFVWFDSTTAIQPYDHPEIHGIPDTLPTGL